MPYQTLTEQLGDLWICFWMWETLVEENRIFIFVGKAIYYFLKIKKVKLFLHLDSLFICC